MAKQFNNRSEKIEFLKGLTNGKRSLDEVSLGSGVSVWIKRPEREIYEGYGLQLNLEQFEDFKKSYPRKKNIILHVVYGANKPINE
ncbi:MAG TPA: hypothetical protein VD794_07770 [Flavisolibacter sp.]|nr:hypothetical protein [Flavisolibacter sp.]